MWRACSRSGGSGGRSCGSCSKKHRYDRPCQHRPDVFCQPAVVEAWRISRVGLVSLACSCSGQRLLSIFCGHACSYATPPPCRPKGSRITSRWTALRPTCARLLRCVAAELRTPSSGSSGSSGSSTVMQAGHLCGNKANTPRCSPCLPTLARWAGRLQCRCCAANPTPPPSQPSPPLTPARPCRSFGPPATRDRSCSTSSWSARCRRRAWIGVASGLASPKRACRC